NCIEFVEIYISCAKAGLVAVPINFRLNEKEILFIIKNSDSKLIITEEKFIETIDLIRPSLITQGWQSNSFLQIKHRVNSNFLSYEDLIFTGSNKTLKVNISDHDPWLILYTSGTTGTSKGVIRSHLSYTAFFLINAAEFGFTINDYGFTTMPLSHVNSTFYGFVFTYLGASVFIGKEYSFNAKEFLKIVDREKITFTSLIPSHYQIIFSLAEDFTNKIDRSSLTKLLTSSAPVRRKTKLKIMKFFPNARLFEAYGSTEAGLVTILRPEEQLEKLGSIGRECIGSDNIKILDPETQKPVPEGEIGELFSRSPMMFTKYNKLPEKTKESLLKDGYFSAGDMARRDQHGYYYLVDRKNNMIITGGENVYPSEIETAVTQHEGVLDCAALGLPDKKWGEIITAVIIPEDSNKANLTGDEIITFCKSKLSSFKVPKKVIFTSMAEMPRTASGKILHRKLRERYSELDEE
ncbi:MAG: class I adenylate-forming enzyme family protein, partial [Candidatus Heimdallarchaeota archaeon]